MLEGLLSFPKEVVGRTGETKQGGGDTRPKTSRLPSAAPRNHWKPDARIVGKGEGSEERRVESLGTLRKKAPTRKNGLKEEKNGESENQTNQLTQRKSLTQFL